MIVQLFNSGVVSGPETLVLPALPLFREPHVVVFLVESRRGPAGLAPLQYARARGLRVEVVEVSSRVDLLALGRLRDTLRRLAPGIVHAHDVKASTYAWLASRHERWALVSTHHGVGGRPDWKTRLYEEFYSRFVLPRMNMAITVSREDQYTLLRRGLNPQHLAFVANGVTRRRWSGSERQAERRRLRAGWREELGDLGEGTALLGMVARLSAEKRHEYCLRTLAELRRTRPDLPWRLLALGGGSLEARLRRRSAELGLTNHVHWLGYREDAADWMPGLDLLLFTSSAEGLPIAALEAGWAALPLFTTNVGSLPELVSTGRTAGGVVFPREQEHAHTARSLAWLLEHPRERERMGERLQNRVAREYSAEAWVQRMEDIYRSV